MRFFPRYGEQAGSEGGVSSRVGSEASGGAWRGSEAQVEDWAGRARAAQGRRYLFPPPHPPNETRRSPARPGSGRRPLQRPLGQGGARGLLAPRSPPSRLPRQLAAEPGPPSPGSSPSSPPARPAARPLPICREAQGESAGSRARGHRRPGSREKKVSAPSSCTGLPRSGLGCGGIQALRYSAAISHAEPDEGLGYFLWSRGEGGQEGVLPLGKA